MKKLLFVLAFAGISVASMAQSTETVPTLKHSVATNSFWSNWFIQVGANWNAWYSGQEHGQGLDNSPIEDFRATPGAAIAIGKWFTPGIGLRTKVQGIWGKRVDDGTKEGNFNKYWTLNEHVLFNVSNMLCGYNPNRVWNFIPFVGGGLSRSMSYNLYGMQLSAGILNQFNVSKHVAINLELGWNRMEGDVDGNETVTRPNRGWESHDNNLYGEIGLTFNLGKATWNKVPDVDAIMAQNQAALDALNAKLNDALAENARLRDMLAKQPKPEPGKTVKEFITTPVSVFFNIDKTNIASQKDLVNVRAVAKYAKENNNNLLVTGYADSATGSARHNQWLSEERAKTVAKELNKMGIAPEKIQTVGKGGVDILSPISFNRRATVQVTE